MTEKQSHSTTTNIPAYVFHDSFASDSFSHCQSEDMPQTAAEALSLLSAKLAERRPSSQDRERS